METHVNTSDPQEARKFLFDLSFDNDMSRLSRAAEKSKQPVTQEQLEQACRDAYSKGYNDGQMSATESQQQSANLLLNSINKQLDRVMDESAAQWQDQMTSFQKIVLVIARKILPTFTQRHGLEEIETIVAKVFSEMGREPRLVFRVPESQFDDAKTRIEALSSQAAYAGKLVILGDPAMAVSECRIEWADGGIERDLKKLWKDIERVMGETHSFESPMMDQPSQAEPTASSALQTPILASPAPQEKGAGQANPNTINMGDES